MKNKTTTALALILTLVLFLTTFVGCWDDDDADKGFRIGFVQNNLDIVEEGLFIAMSSDKSFFSKEDMTFNLHFGTTAEKLEGWNDERFDPVCVALYFGYNDHRTTSFADYKNIEKLDLIREFEIDDFYTEKYKVTAESAGKWTNSNIYTFSHSEEFNMAEYFTFDESQIGGIAVKGLTISVIFFDNEEEIFIFGNVGRLNAWNNKFFMTEEIGYRIIDANTVKLFNW